MNRLVYPLILAGMTGLFGTGCTQSVSAIDLSLQDASVVRPGQPGENNKAIDPAKAQLSVVELQMAFMERQSALQKEFMQNQKTWQTETKPSPAKPTPASVTSATRSAGDITLNAPWKCVPSGLKSVIADVSRKFGPVTVNSTHRTKSKNRKVGGAKNSYHIGCRAVDFRVSGNKSAVLKYLRAHPQVGGVKLYRSGYFHIDNGPKRTWR